MNMTLLQMAALLAKINLGFTKWSTRALGRHWDFGTLPTSPMYWGLFKIFLSRAHFYHRPLTMEMLESEFKIVQTGEQIYGYYESEESGE